MNNAVNTKMIYDYIKDNNLSKTEFCKLCKIGVSTLNRIMTNNNFNLISIFRIAKTMRVKVCELFI